MSTTINQSGEEVTLVKGAPEIIIASCKSMMQQDGTIQNLDAIDLGSIRQAMEQAASQAMRVLGFAIKQKTTDSDDALTLCGFICIQDPLRPEVRNAIADCKSAGIQVIMITGDNPITANAIGVEAGLAIEGKTELITSDMLAQMTDEQVKEHLPKLTILARAKPLDKYRIVKLLQEMQHVVAVTGDGTNDAPALKKPM